MAQEVNNQQTSPNNLIELHDINRVFGIGEAESYALQNFYLQVKPGEFIMIMGPSGCGKTTLLNILGFLDHPTSGQYFLNQTPTSHFSSRRLAKLRSQKIGIIFQEYNLIPTLTVLENVALPLIYAGVSHTKAIIKASASPLLAPWSPIRKLFSPMSRPAVSIRRAPKLLCRNFTVSTKPVILLLW